MSVSAQRFLCCYLLAFSAVVLSTSGTNIESSSIDLASAKNNDDTAPTTPNRSPRSTRSRRLTVRRRTNIFFATTTVDVTKEEKRLRRNKRKFKRLVTERGIDYRYVAGEAGDGTVRMQIEVVDGDLSVTNNGDNQDEEDDQKEHLTLLQAFGTINKALRSAKRMGTDEFDRYEVSYNRKWGYVIRADISLPGGTAKGSNRAVAPTAVSFTAKNFRAIGGPVCGTENKCDAECANQCQFSTTGFNQACCISDCPDALGCSDVIDPSGYDYEYRKTGTKNRIELWLQPSVGEATKVEIPDPEHVHFKFFALADTPYDPRADTCLDANGTDQDPCLMYLEYGEEACRNCVESGDSCFDSFPANNTCTYQGGGYNCLKTSVIPHIKSKTSEALFVGHIGDFLKGQGGGSTKRCQEASFASRSNLFALLESATNSLANDEIDFFIVPGDNDWNECYNFEANVVRWRDTFANEGSIFEKFDRTSAPTIGDVTSFPSVSRAPTLTNTSETGNEKFFFEAGDTAVIGINEPSGSTSSYHEANAAWIEGNLDGKCFKSMVIFGHDDNFDGSDWERSREVLANYYDTCGPVPTIYICGDSHPR